MGRHRTQASILEGANLLVSDLFLSTKPESSCVISPLIFFFLIGAIAPVVPWALSKRYPNSVFKYIKWDCQPLVGCTALMIYPCSLPVIFNGTGSIPPATAINYVPWAWVRFPFNFNLHLMVCDSAVGFIFQYVIRRFVAYFKVWLKMDFYSRYA